MAAHTSTHIEGLGVFTITSHVVESLALKPYIEFRLEHRSELDGSFLGFCAMGSHLFCTEALERIQDEQAAGKAELRARTQ